MTIKFCKDCKWMLVERMVCSHSKSQSGVEYLVSGDETKIRLFSCFAMRSGICSKNGTLWESKDETK